MSTEVSREFTHAYTYDLAGNRIATAYGTGRIETRTFDALNRPVSITEGGRTTSYHYDLAGRAVGQLSGNGQWATSHYDAQGRLVRRTLREGTGGGSPALAELAFRYDAVGNLRQQEEWWPGEVARSGVRTTMLAYDSNDRMRQEVVNQGASQTSTNYSYDKMGNRLSKSVVVDGALQKNTVYGSNGRHQLKSWVETNGAGLLQRSVSLTYDAAGNRITQKITPAGGTMQTTTYAWDYDNRLTSVTLPDSSVHSYAYDYRTRRITRSEPGSNPVAMTFSGGLSVAEFEVTDPGTGTLNTQPTVEYQRGPDMGGGVGGLLYSLRSGTAKFNLSNGRGDVVAQSDSSGDLTWTASYEAYGKRPVETGVNADRQRANTKEEDPTGLLNEGFRYRDLETGVWLSRDPAGFVDGPNLYAYVRQNPWTSWDPEGLQTFLAPQPPMVLPRIAPAPSIPFTNPTPVPRLVPGPYVPPTVPTVRIAPPPSALMMPDGGTSPQPQPQPNPTQTQQKTEEKNVRYLYRVMKPASDGFPESEPPLSPLRRTGVRVPGDIAPDADGSAQPLTGGMSVAPDSPRNLHPTVRPKVLGGHNPKDQLYRIKESDLGPNLRYVPDPPVPGELPHGTVQPTQKVPFEKYEQDLKGTRLKWERVDPNNYIKRIPPEVQAWLT